MLFQEFLIWIWKFVPSCLWNFVADLMHLIRFIILVFRSVLASILLSRWIESIRFGGLEIPNIVKTGHLALTFIFFNLSYNYNKVYLWNFRTERSPNKNQYIKKSNRFYHEFLLQQQQQNWKRKLKKKRLIQKAWMSLWAILDLNQGPKDYESSALTAELMARNGKKNNIRFWRDKSR